MKFRRLRKRQLSYSVATLIMSSILNVNCNKLVQIPNPISSVTANQVFSSDATATSAMLGIYSYMVQGQSFSNGSTTLMAGESADELTDEIPGNEALDLFLVNHLNAIQSSGAVTSYFWQPAYFDIYNANAIIAGVQSSTGISPGTRNQLIGEAKFIRAFCYFYLTGFIGNVPLDLNIDFNKTVLLSGSPQAQIYQQIIDDLHDAQGLMISDFSLTNGQPIRANKWAATALLARVYLYQENWAGADSAANAVINSGLFNLVPLPLVPEVPPNVLPDSDAFCANSKEAILQLQLPNAYPFATLEGNTFIPYFSTSFPTYWMTPQLLAAFEPGDLRRINWVDSANPGGYYYYPFKYKVEFGQSWPAAENYTLLRLAEQYLIRAEAETEPGGQQNLSQAVADINIIRSRAALPGLSIGLSQSQVLSAIQQERRIELFAEWGHRWLDLKRWGIAIDTLSNIAYKNSNINSAQLLYPIPVQETQTDPNLKQNPGY
jgi:hypothetical protein